MPPLHAGQLRYHVRFICYPLSLSLSLCIVASTRCVKKKSSPCRCAGLLSPIDRMEKCFDQYYWAANYSSWSLVLMLYNYLCKHLSQKMCLLYFYRRRILRCCKRQESNDDFDSSSQSYSNSSPSILLATIMAFNYRSRQPIDSLVDWLDRWLVITTTTAAASIMRTELVLAPTTTSMLQRRHRHHPSSLHYYQQQQRQHDEHS